MTTKALGDCGRGVLGERIKMPSIICYSSPYILLCFYFSLPLCISFIPKSVKQYKQTLLVHRISRLCSSVFLDQFY